MSQQAGLSLPAGQAQGHFCSSKARPVCRHSGPTGQWNPSNARDAHRRQRHIRWWSLLITGNAAKARSRLCLKCINHNPLGKSLDFARCRNIFNIFSFVEKPSQPSRPAQQHIQATSSAWTRLPGALHGPGHNPGGRSAQFATAGSTILLLSARSESRIPEQRRDDRVAAQLGEGVNVNTGRAHHIVPTSAHSVGLQPSQQLEDHLWQGRQLRGRGSCSFALFCKLFSIDCALNRLMIGLLRTFFSSVEIKPMNHKHKMKEKCEHVCFS